MSIYFPIETNENYTQSMCVGVKQMKIIFEDNSQILDPKFQQQAKSNEGKPQNLFIYVSIASKI
jgi:hypothetical protein